MATAFAARGWPATARALDIADTAALRTLVTETGPFDILCNAAGTARHAPALKTTEPDYDAVMHTNTRAAFFVAQAVVRTMPPGGSIIQISSQMGHVGGPDRAVYAASEHGLKGMTKAMAIDCCRATSASTRSAPPSCVRR